MCRAYGRMTWPPSTSFQQATQRVEAGVLASTGHMGDQGGASLVEAEWLFRSTPSQVMGRVPVGPRSGCLSSPGVNTLARGDC